MTVFFAASVLVCSALAQQTLDEPIFFSKPSDNGILNSGNGSKAASAADTGMLPDKSSRIFSAPQSSNPGMVLPPPTATPRANALDKRKNWTLMTPEEIMGVPTPEKMFGLPDENADDKLPLDQRYLKRRQDAATAMTANGVDNVNDFNSSLLNQQDENSIFSNPNKQANNDSPSSSSPIFGYSKNPLFNQDKGIDSSWNKSFTTPTTLKSSGPDLVKEAEMERFRDLIGGSKPANNSSTALDSTANKNFQSLAQVDMFGHPLANSGNQLNQLNQPSTLSTLSQLPETYTKPPPPKKQWWTPKQPPWLLNGPSAAGAPPVRQF